MKAAVVDRYGPPNVVRVVEVPNPAPRATEVLVRVNAVAVTAADSRIRAARFPRGFGPFARLMFGVVRPRRKVLGSTFSGVVDAVGAKVDGVAVGDEVCGMAGMRMGAHAELVAVPESKVVRKPAAVSHLDAAAVLFGGSTALHLLRDRGSVQRGDAVLINGASGAIGTSAVQLAKYFGARVTGVTSSANTALVSRIGADRVIDYTTTDLSDVGERFDIVLDAVGNISPASGRKLLTERGRLLLAVADLWATLVPRRRVVAGAAPESTADFELLLQLVESGQLAVVAEDLGDLEDIVTAYARVDSGRKVGNIVLRP
ncbi:NAD(P)-dependent alcohol dehydrogenase [Rhodococcus sp. ABRD24]|uniref:NAD(P)-dependent alcohol dehydrogenase n=1 Tax=Rhodococcus sp. ABRD24 TaxID=2507582 RepID=UPI00104014F4|nr:NAD(P)-dependent alcohol dehydrogenase [Rhodococcus sp. ABRD24]QBJ97308.1 NAD(P)-dependent alcohol dehydrogenase [Rhodococcus sp. ABRD24]